jgi:flavin reductase
MSTRIGPEQRRLEHVNPTVIGPAYERGDEDRSKRFRRTAGQFPTGVTVLSTALDGEPYGMTVNSFASVSLRPPLVLVSVNRESRTYEHIRKSGVFAITVLSADQQEVARWFANADRPAGADSFASVAWRPGPYTGSPILVDGVSYFDCVVNALHRTGDHTLVIGGVRAFDVLSERPPLLFVRSRFLQTPEQA